MLPRALTNLILSYTVVRSCNLNLSGNFPENLEAGLEEADVLPRDERFN